MESWYVYIVECSDKTLYTGISNDVPKRISKHNSGKGAKYTKKRLPVTLKWVKRLDNKSQAAKEEYKIKKLRRKEKLKLIENMSKETEGDFKKLVNNMFNKNSDSEIFKRYKINVNEIKTIDDVKLVLKHMDLHFYPTDEETFEEIKHLLIKA